jgi:hypothetical protein
VYSSLLIAAVVSFSLSGCEGTCQEGLAVQQQKSAAVPANREPQADKPTRLTWDDLQLPHEDRFAPGDLSALAKKLKDRRIKITGVMHGGVSSAKTNSEFVLMRNRPNRFGPGGPIDVLMKVTLATGRTVAYVDDSIQVEGILRIDPVNGEDGSIWCVYHLHDARVYQSGKVIDDPAAKSKPVK